MSLVIIFGGAGSGKSTLLRKHLMEASVQEPDIRHIILVPEQFTMQTQRDILAAHPRGAAANVEVLSFERLAYRISEEFGREETAVLTEMGKQMLLRRASEDSRRDLTVFSGSIRRTGFLRSVSEMLSEFYQYDAGDLDGIAQTIADRPLLAAKLRDLAVIKRQFEECRGPVSMTAEELLPRLLRMLPESGYMRGTRLYMDSFTGFTPVQFSILNILMTQTSHMEIALLLPEREAAEKEIRMSDLFRLGKSTAADLMKAAEEKGIKCQTVMLREDLRHKDAPQLAFLAAHFLRYGKKEKYRGDGSSIKIIRLRNEAAEAACAAGVISRLVKEEGCRYRDIAVVTGDARTYRRYLVTEFQRAGIPFFCDSRKGLMGDPLAEFLLSALEILSRDFSYESVMRFLRCGIGPVDPEDADLLDTYLYITGIRGIRAYSRDFEWCPEKELAERMERINAARKAVVDLLESLFPPAGEAAPAGAWWTDALTRLMEKADVPGRMAALAEAAAAEGDGERAEEYSRAGEFMEEFLAEVRALFAEETFGAEDFLKILEAGLSEGKLGMLPNGMDLIQIGDLMRSRQNEIRVLILLGMNDGMIPSSGGGRGILSENERTLLMERGVRLAPAAEDQACQGRVYLYMLLCRPKEKLFITFHTQDGRGNAVRPSYLLPGLLSMFEGMKVCPGEELDPADRLTGRAALEMAVAEKMPGKAAGTEKDGEGKETGDKEFDILAALLYRTDRDAFEKILSAAFPTAADDRIRPETADLLYGKDIRLNVTRMEKFAACAAAHFLRYGLDLKERKQFAVDQMDRGTFFHKVMQIFFSLMREEKLEIGALTEEDRARLTGKAVSIAKRE